MTREELNEALASAEAEKAFADYIDNSYRRARVIEDADRRIRGIKADLAALDRK